MVESMGEGHVGKVKLTSHIVMEMGDEFCGVAERKSMVIGVGCGLGERDRRDGETGDRTDLKGTN